MIRISAKWGPNAGAPPPSPLRNWVQFFNVVLVVGFVGLQISAFKDLYDTGADSSAEWIRFLGRQAILLLPSLFYLRAVFAINRLVARSEADGHEPLASSVNQIGQALIWGAAASILIVPTLLDWTQGRYYDFDIDTRMENLVIVSVGLGLMRLAEVLGRAEAAKAELDTIL